jgi:membrane-anchored glycerophosphoryl diester phosphodiesterase (GDPDase)
MRIQLRALKLSFVPFIGLFLSRQLHTNIVLPDFTTEFTGIFNNFQYLLRILFYLGV